MLWSMKNQKPGRRAVPPTVAAVVRPVSKRLSAILDLVVEMRHLEDLKLKRLAHIEHRIELLTSAVAANRRATARLRTAR